MEATRKNKGTSSVAALQEMEKKGEIERGQVEKILSENKLASPGVVLEKAKAQAEKNNEDRKKDGTAQKVKERERSKRKFDNKS